MTTTVGKWFEIDSKKGQVYLVGAATRELAFEYHDKGYIALEANLGFEDGKTISFSQGGNTATATDDENGFSEDDIGKYIYTGDGWHKILSVSDATIVGCGKNLYDVSDKRSFSDGVTVDADGWITVTADNSAGSGIAFMNCATNPSLAIRPSTQYAVVCEIAQINVSGSLDFRIVSTENDVLLSQFAQMFSLAVNESTQTGTRIQVLTSRADLSDAGSMLRTYIGFAKGASGTIKFRLSVLADTAITAETFEYEPYHDVPFLALDNTQGQLQTVALEAGCVAQQAGTGDPSPTNIRAISGRESVEVVACGKNLIDTSLVSDEEKNGITVTRNPDGSIRLEGTSTADLFINLKIHGGKIFRNIESAVRVNAMNSPKTYGGYTAKDVYIEQRPTDTYTRVFLYIVSGTNLDKTYYPQFELGSTATAYEPYTPMGGGVVTPTEPLYGLPDAEDTVEVSVDGDVTVTRRTNALVLDGTENWTLSENTSAGAHRFNMPNVTPAPKLTGNNALAPAYLCSHYAFLSADATWSGNRGASFASTAANLQICDMDYADVQAWKAYLAAQKAAGTPVTIVYELATPTTETPADVDPIVPQAGEVNVFTDTDSLNITLYKTENNKYASVTGSFSQTQNDFASMLTQMNEISISGEDVELTKLEIDYVPQVR